MPKTEDSLTIRWPEASLAYFAEGAHDGPGWYYWDTDYRDEGSIGAFPTREEAEKHANEAGYRLKAPESPRALPTSHVTLANANGGYKLECHHCQCSYQPALPISITMFVALMNSFGEEHKDCPPPAASEEAIRG